MSIARLCSKQCVAHWTGDRRPIVTVLATSLVLAGRFVALPLMAEEVTLATPLITRPSTERLTNPSEDAVSQVRRGDWFVVETLNFRVWSRINSVETVACARRCETARCELQAKWCVDSLTQTWTPKADIVIHRSIDEFRTALGPQSAGSSGCTTIRQENDRVTVRRIDLRADVHGWNTSSLPHELTHLILADRFGGRRLPRWVDEGIAVLAESPEKQAKRQKAASGVRAISLSQLLSSTEYPVAQERDAFYAQSTALTDYLVRLGGGIRFLAFVERTIDSGPDIALKEFYGLDDIRALERELNSKTSRAGPGIQSEPGDATCQTILR